MKISRQASPLQIMTDQNNWGNMITNDARSTREIKSWTSMAKEAVYKKTLFISKMDLTLRKKLVRCYIWSTVVYGAETWTIQKVDWKYLQRFEIWCWRIEKISSSDCVRNEEVLHRVKGDRNILDTLQRRKASWISHISRSNWLLKHDIDRKIEGRIEVKVTWRWCKNLLILRKWENTWK